MGEAISPLGSLNGRQTGSARHLAPPLTDERRRVSVMNVIMFILWLRSADCPTAGDHITAPTWNCPSSNKRDCIFPCMSLHFTTCVAKWNYSSFFLNQAAYDYAVATLNRCYTVRQQPSSNYSFIPDGWSIKVRSLTALIINLPSGGGALLLFPFSTEVDAHIKHDQSLK